MEQNSTILIPLTWCTYIVIEAQVLTVKRLLGFFPHIKVLSLLVFGSFNSVLQIISPPGRQVLQVRSSLLQKRYMALITWTNSKLSYLGTDNTTVLQYSFKLNLEQLISLQEAPLKTQVAKE